MKRSLSSMEPTPSPMEDSTEMLSELFSNALLRHRLFEYMDYGDCIRISMLNMYFYWIHRNYCHRLSWRIERHSSEKLRRLGHSMARITILSLDLFDEELFVEDLPPSLRDLRIHSDRDCLLLKYRNLGERRGIASKLTRLRVRLRPALSGYGRVRLDTRILPLVKFVHLELNYTSCIKMAHLTYYAPWIFVPDETTILIGSSSGDQPLPEDFTLNNRLRKTADFRGDVDDPRLSASAMN
jgi:hypothetical protein